MAQSKLNCRLYPAEFLALVYTLRQAIQCPPDPASYANKPDYLTALSSYALLIDYRTRLRCSVMPGRWAEKDTARPHRFSLPVAVALALYAHLCRFGAKSHDEQQLLNALNKSLTDGNALYLAAFRQPVDHLHDG